MPKVTFMVDERIVNPVYRPYIDDDTRMQIFYGGASSGKSFFLAQRCIMDMLRGGHNFLIVRKIARYIRKSVFNEVTKAISAFHATKFFSVNSSDMVITCKNGGQILFVGLDDVEKVKSITPTQGVITDIWVEEATEASYEDIKQLEKRLRGKSSVPKRIVLSFNPVYKTHWIYTEYFAGRWDDTQTELREPKLSILKTTYRDNTHLTADDIEALESETDPYFRDVYTNGSWGVLGDVIFTNWNAEDLSGREFPSYCCGVDFGYAKDPAAIVKCHYDRKRQMLYIVNAAYVYKSTNDILAAEIKRICGYETVLCDEAEPKSIQELRNYSVSALPAPKNGGSAIKTVLFGIQWLQHLSIIVDASLVEAINEFTVYQWQRDKDGNAIPSPVDRDNHIIDALRYALVYEMGWIENVRHSDIQIPLAGKM